MHHFARKYHKFPGGACPQTPLAVGAFGTSLCHIRLPLLKILATALVRLHYLHVLETRGRQAEVPMPVGIIV